MQSSSRYGPQERRDKPAAPSGSLGPRRKSKSRQELEEKPGENEDHEDEVHGISLSFPTQSLP